MGKRKNLVDAVLVMATPPKRGFRSWFQRLPADAQAELEAVRDAFNPEIHEKSQYARAVMAAATERGWKTCGIQGVIAWLDRKR